MFFECRNITFKYPGAQNFVFQNLSFRLGEPGFNALFGPSGIGKTSLAKIIIGVQTIARTRGTVCAPFFYAIPKRKHERGRQMWNFEDTMLNSGKRTQLGDAIGWIARRTGELSRMSPKFPALIQNATRSNERAHEPIDLNQDSK